jgi:hypothetical protein
VELDRDAVFIVTGVSAPEIIERCAAVRSGAQPRSTGSERRDRRSGHKLVDFADVSDEDFVRNVHKVLLGRPPAPPEVERRLAELRDHSRLEIVIRLALSPEGRVAPRPQVRGLGLPLLRSLGRAIELARTTPVTAAATRRVEGAFRSVLGRGRGAR